MVLFSVPYGRTSRRRLPAGAANAGRKVRPLLRHFAESAAERNHPLGKNKRSVWKIPVRSYHGAHLATFPKDLVKPCILAGCPKGGVVLDPFAGTGTVGQVAEELGRNAILVELNPVYVEMQRERNRIQKVVDSDEAEASARAGRRQGWLF